MFEIPAALLSWFYGLTNSYTIAIAMIAAVVMAITTPLTLKSTKGMLEMQKLAPEMRKLQNEYRNDRTKLNEEMMKLYQEHKVNPMASCLPLLAQAPVFYIMFRVLRGMAYQPSGAARPVVRRRVGVRSTVPTRCSIRASSPAIWPSTPRCTSRCSVNSRSCRSGSTCRSRPPKPSLRGSAPASGTCCWSCCWPGCTSCSSAWLQLVPSISPTMSAGQQKLMQYLPVFFAVFQIFFLAALVVYYIFQTIFRILQQAYITRAFYGHDESLGRQAQRAGDAAREEAKKNPDGGGGGFFAQAKRDLAGPGARRQGHRNGQDTSAGNAAKNAKAAKDASCRDGSAPTSKRVTPPKNRPTPSSGAKGRPTPTRQEAQANKAKSKQVLEVVATQSPEEILVTVGRMGARSPCSRKRTSSWSGSKPPRRPSRPRVKRPWINSASVPTRPSST